MNVKTVLIVLGVILVVIVAVATYLLWNYAKKCKKIFKRNSDKKSLIDIKLFENPISVRTVKVQQPFITSDFYHRSKLENIEKRRFTVFDVYKSHITSSIHSKNSKKFEPNISDDLKYYLKSLNKVTSNTFRRNSSIIQSEPTEEPTVATKNLIESKNIKKRVSWIIEKRRTISNAFYQEAGRLTFRSEYSEDNKTLTIHLLRLIGLASQKPANEVNPFVQAYLVSTKVPGKLYTHTTKYQKGKKKIYFDEKLIFPNICKKDKDIYTLKIKVLNHVRLTSCETLGKVHVPIKSLFLNSLQTYQLDLFVKRNQKESKPLLMISLNHFAFKNKLEVIIHQIKNLPESSNYIYVIVALVKADYIEKKDSLPRQYINQQVFNEFFEFDIHTSTDLSLKSFSLVITLVKKVDDGVDDIIGHVIFSEYFSYSATASHWKAVEKASYKRITEWHSLINPYIT